MFKQALIRMWNKFFAEPQDIEPIIPKGKNDLVGWNYRLVRQRFDYTKWYKDQGKELPAGHEPYENTFGIHEAWFDKGNKVHAITEDAVVPIGASPEELKETIQKMYMLAFEKPVLDFDLIPEPGALPIDVSDVKDLNVVAKPASEIIEEAQSCCNDHVFPEKSCGCDH
jgi:hypothetical protein